MFFRSIFGLKNNIKENKVEVVDFLRGGAMMLVLLHHSFLFPFGHYILAFHMPLFFIIAGYVFHIGNGINHTFKQYIKRRFFRLILPYFLFEILNFIVYCVICLIDHNSILWQKGLYSIVTVLNNDYPGLYQRLWFLPCMFLADIYSFWVLKFFKDKKPMLILSVLTLLVLSYLTSKVINFRIPFTIDNSLMAAAFIIIGYLLGGFIDILVKKGNDWFKIILAVFALLYLYYAVAKTNLSYMNMSGNAYGEYTVSLTCAMAGSIAYTIIASYIYLLIKNVGVLKRFVLWYGTNSLAVFPVHLTIKVMILKYAFNLAKWYYMFVIMLFLSVIIVNIIKNYLPFMLGEKYKKYNVPYKVDTTRERDCLKC